MAADYSVRYGDTLKVHEGQLRQGTNADGTPKAYVPSSRSILRMVLSQQGGGSRLELLCSFDSNGAWSLAWTAESFDVLSSGVVPSTVLSFDCYLEQTDEIGRKLTFPDDPSQQLYQLDLLPPIT